MRPACLILGLTLLSACRPAAPAGAQAGRAPATDGEERLRAVLTCREPQALAQGRAFLEARFHQAPKVTCDGDRYPVRCAIDPALTLGAAKLSWFSLESVEGDRATLQLPAPTEAVQPALPATGAKLAAASDLSGTAVFCAMTPGALEDGAIAGSLSYPGEGLPSMRVCAFELTDGTPYCTATHQGQARYRIDAVPRGDYLVVAFPQAEADAPGGYSECVPALDAACADHALRVVVVRPGTTTAGIDPTDFYADEPERADWPQPPALE